MAITETDFLTFAHSLKEESEIHYRNAISQAYYAAYHGCLKLCTPQLAEANESCANLISYLLNSPDAKQRQLAYLLKQLKALHIVANYQLQENISLTDKEMVIRQTEKLIELLSGNG